MISEPSGNAGELAPLVRISARHFVAGVVIGERAAPIVSYMAGWSPERIASYCRSNGWSMEVVQ